MDKVVLYSTTRLSFQEMAATIFNMDKDPAFYGKGITICSLETGEIFAYRNAYGFWEILV